METYLGHMHRREGKEQMLLSVPSVVPPGRRANRTHGLWPWIKWPVILFAVLFGGIFVVLFFSNLAHGTL
jgi:hypothetical protein